MTRSAVAVVAVLALPFALAACGGDDEVTTDLPRTTPELTIPAEPTRAGDESGTDTTATTPEGGTGDAAGEPAPGAAAPADGAGAAPAAPPAEQPAPATGGEGGGAAPAEPAPDTGGAAGEFSEFCAQNPSADGC